MLHLVLFCCQGWIKILLWSSPSVSVHEGGFRCGFGYFAKGNVPTYFRNWLPRHLFKLPIFWIFYLFIVNIVALFSFIVCELKLNHFYIFKIITKVTLSVVIVRLFIVGINLVGEGRMLVCIQDNLYLGFKLF